MMNTISPTHSVHYTPPAQTPRALSEAGASDKSEVRETFDKFVGEVFFGQMLKSMRKTVGKPAYFHGGRAEEIFSEQLDQVLSEKMTDACAHDLTGPMFELFQLGRPS